MSLGERCARAMGWTPYTTKNTWLDKGGVIRPTPGPENSWEDWGRFVEWAEGRSIHWRWNAGTVMAENRRENRVHHAQDVYTLSGFRRALIEGILDVVEPGEMLPNLTGQEIESELKKIVEEPNGN